MSIDKTENINGNDRKNIKYNINKNTISTGEKRVQISLHKFLFGIKSMKANWLLLAGILSLIVYSSLIVLVRVLLALSINYIRNKNSSELNFFCLILVIMGPVCSAMCILTGYLFKKHFEEICNKYKHNYYNLVFKQDFSWFNTQDLNKLSESIKIDIDKIERGVKFNFFILFLYYYK